MIHTHRNEAIGSRSPLFCVSLKVRSALCRAPEGCGMSFLAYPSFCFDSDKVSALRCSSNSGRASVFMSVHWGFNILSLSCASSSLPGASLPHLTAAATFWEHHCRPQCCIMQPSYLGCPLPSPPLSNFHLPPWGAFLVHPQARWGLFLAPLTLCSHTSPAW